jgi:hypothetical protein
MRTPSLGKSHAGAGVGRLPHVPLPEMCVIPPTPRRNLLGKAGENRGLVGMIIEIGNLTRTSSESSTVSPTSTTFESSSQGHSSSDEGDGETETETEVEEEGDLGLLPDESWIAVICGVSKEQWNAENEEGGLPEGFYVAPRDVYMPDLIAVGDVVLGKLVSIVLVVIERHSWMHDRGMV